MASSAPLADPLQVPEGLAKLLGVAYGTVRSRSSVHRPRPGFEQKRCKDGSSVW